MLLALFWLLKNTRLQIMIEGGFWIFMQSWHSVIEFCNAFLKQCQLLGNNDTLTWARTLSGTSQKRKNIEFTTYKTGLVLLASFIISGCA